MRPTIAEEREYKKNNFVYKKHLVKCDQCGRLFQARRSTAKFCKTACRVKWNRENASEGVANDYCQ